MKERIATAIATPNIAFVKYWGNRDERLILPAGGSISMTLDRTFTTTTTVWFSDSLSADEIWLNGKKVGPQEAKRIVEHLDLMRRAGQCRLRAKVVSRNNFPTAAGLASSASGFAALTLACAKALGVRRSMTELSALARRGSGSACRSLFGGFVEWVRGERKDGSDSIAQQIAPASHWPGLVDIVAIASEGRKHISSRDAMRRTVETSRLFKQRMQMHPGMLKQVRNAIMQKNAELLFDSIMRESNSMHAVMKDSRPPIIYMSEVSRRIVDAVRAFNADAGGMKCGYTFDAGPNAHVITTRKNEAAVRRMLARVKGVKRVVSAGVGKGPAYAAKHLFKI
ncbi:MAG: diphosphomevalonate decarboxylase [Candidatus Burarchaeum sp.]|nr:diphosphomevalonate decarboxylase [Candidatus Burarchaeum sp.]MDO8339680.1 diphosphomevalonate decarboxylase [Candidatus Burarchaeum sp.]